MTASTISRLETGARRLTLAQVERLAAALEVSTDALLADGSRRPIPRRTAARGGRSGRSAPTGPRVYRIVPAGRGAALHQHEGHQWLYVLDGAVRLLVGASDRVLAAGEAADVLHLGAARARRGRVARPRRS